MSLKHLVPWVCLLALAACAPVKDTMIAPSDNLSSEKIWNNFLRLKGNSSVPMLSEGSLRFGEEGNTHRVTWLIWGNHSRALRFDIQAGVGSTLAKAWLDNDILLLYLPDENQLLHGTDVPQDVLHRTGLDLPLPLHALYAVMQGDFAAALDNPRILSSQSLPEGKTAVELGTDSLDMPLLRLELDSGGYPVRWSMPQSWDIKISYNDEHLPRKIDGTRYLKQEQSKLRFVLLIKNRQARQEFPQSELDLRLPADVQYISGY